MAKTIHFTVYPFVAQECELEVPDNAEVNDGYVNDHWNEIKFGAPQYDYCGCDIEYTD